MSRGGSSIESPGPPRRADLLEAGRRLRDGCPRASHASWRAPSDRADPLALLEASSEGRIAELVPVRHGRMLRSPFAWFRGAALHMAADLARTPTSGLRVQSCGDAHLENFGVYATPERRAVFDINDFDETLPAPWEWDLKRLATSVVLACRGGAFDRHATREATLAAVRAYRQRMAELCEMRVLDVWYASYDMDAVLAMVDDEEARERGQTRLAEARQPSADAARHPDVVTDGSGRARIRDEPPYTYHWSENGGEPLMEGARQAFAAYRSSLPAHRRVLLDRFELADVAIKVVGVGSVGTRCFVLLLMAGEDDPLLLQVKEARASVLEPYAGASTLSSHGERIVVGSRVMQSASDLFLGWTRGAGGRDYYVRQLRDLKLGPMVERFTPGFMEQYAALCGSALANAHARSGEPARIAGYLGRSDAFDEAIADFATAYADQTERDHAELVKAARTGRLSVDAGS